MHRLLFSIAVLSTTFNLIFPVVAQAQKQEAFETQSDGLSTPPAQHITDATQTTPVDWPLTPKDWLDTDMDTPPPTPISEKKNCTLTLIDGMITKCCETKYDPATHNCVHFTNEFMKLCEEKKLGCLAVRIRCPLEGNHAVSLVSLDVPKGWALVDPQGKVIPVGDVPGFDIPKESICEIMKLPKTCDCDYRLTFSHGIPTFDRTQCRVMFPQRVRCERCCGTQMEVCKENSLPKAEKERCEKARDDCRAECSSMDEIPSPKLCAEKASTSKEFCVYCCGNIPYPADKSIPEDTRKEWYAKCLDACNTSELPKGFSPSICADLAARRGEIVEHKCHRCCSLFSGPPSCEIWNAPGCIGWSATCEKECDKAGKK